jgi:hypothetical protein
MFNLPWLTSKLRSTVKQTPKHACVRDYLSHPSIYLLANRRAAVSVYRRGKSCLTSHNQTALGFIYVASAQTSFYDYDHTYY